MITKTLYLHKLWAFQKKYSVHIGAALGQLCQPVHSNLEGLGL